jgi:hypothetical protein
VKRLLIALAVLLAAPATASAATVHVAPAPLVNGEGPHYTPDGYSFVFFHADPGEQNRVTVAYDDTTPGKVTVTVDDPGAVLTVGHLCQAQGPHKARCTWTTADPDGILIGTEVRLADGDDEVHASGGGTTEAGGTLLYGGSGDDLLVGGGQNDLLDSGSGRDELHGGGGDDLLDDGDTGGTYNPADADVVDGGDGTDLVTSYSRRIVPVSVHLPDDAHAGAAGENDSIRSVEGVDGGEGDDRLIGDDGRNRITGGDGNDLVVGHGAGDYVSGGRGRDDVRGGHGSDVIAPGAGLDRVRCGPGQDTVRAPRAGETLVGPCEKVTWTYGPGLGSPSIVFSPNPTAVRSRTLDFEIPCPTFGEEDGESSGCKGDVVLRRKGHRTVLGRGHVEQGLAVRTTHVHLTRRGRRLLHRRHGFVATLRLTFGKLPDFAWTIPLHR